MGGRANPWMAEGGRLSEIKDQSIFDMTQPQSHGDGLLEFCAATSFLSMAFDKARRVGQVHGPIDLKFKKNPDQDTIVYFQVDGEHFKTRNPDKITVKMASWLPNGSIKIRELRKD